MQAFFMPEFKTLYIYSNEKIEIFEIKRIDQPANAKKEDIFFWFLRDQNGSLKRLKFEGMGEQVGGQYRLLSGMRLNFSDEKGELITSSGCSNLTKKDFISVRAMESLIAHFGQD